MPFQDIFNFARSTSAGGTTVGDQTAGFIPKKENELISSPPQDPFITKAATQQDPKIVRETAPQSNIIFNFINSVTSDINKSSTSIETSMSDPSSVVAPGAGVMSKARETSDKVKDDTPSPSAKVPPTKAPEVMKPEGWDAKPAAETPTPVVVNQP